MKKFSQHIMEHGFARIRRIMMGDLPHINTLGILTAQNPEPGSECSKQRLDNKERNRLLWDQLRASNYGPIKVKGKFGGKWEDSFLVPHVSREEIISLGETYCQEAVIWGNKETDGNGNPYYRFEYIDHGKTVNIRTVSVASPNDVQSRSDFFSQDPASKRKFIIPFFDDPYSQHQPGSKYGTVEPSSPEVSALRKAEFFVPLFDEPDAEVSLSPGLLEVSYYSDKLPKDPYVLELVEEIRRLESELAQRQTGKGKWSARGQIIEALKKLQGL